MSMILSLAAVSDATIGRLHAHPALVWHVIAPDIAEELIAATASGPSWLGRLFGRGTPGPIPPLTLADGEGEMIDIDKAWHGIHYLLTGTAWEGKPPLNVLVTGGREVGKVDVGYGPARTLTAAETRETSAALARLDDESVRSRFAPAEMMKLEIYPEIWDRDPEEDDALGYLMEYLSELREVVNTASAQGLGLLVAIR